MSEDILITFEQGSITVDNSYDLDPITVEVTPEGKDGISLVPCGVWSSTRGYDYLSIVYHDGASYLALKNVPAGTALTNDEYWTVFAAQNSDPTSRSANWGLIRGDMANQLDLQSALGLKANSADVYTKTETDSLLNDKADADNVYTKTETDGLLADKADSADVYTKTESDTLLSNKANSAEVYTKTEADDLLADKADSDDVYTKVEADGLLADKADADDVYTKTETDNLLSIKANTADVYSKTDADTLLSAKANSADVYTKTEANSLLNAKANSADLGTMSAENTSNYYTKTATDNLLNAKANTSDLGTMSAESASDYYTKTATDTLLSAKANSTDLGSLADQDTVNYQTEVTNKPTLGALADHDTVNYSTEVTNKPTLGTMSAESASDYYDKTEVYTKSEVDTLINGSGVVGEKTASGSIVTFETTLAENLGELKVGIEPVQDLHGYDAPWPAGGGKNLADWKVNGTGRSLSISLDSGTYTISAESTLPDGNWYMRFTDSDSTYISDANAVGLSGWSLASSGWFYGDANRQSRTFIVPSGCILVEIGKLNSDGTINAQLESGSTATSYAPYENVCPISGHTGANVYRTGKNLLDSSLLSIFNSNTYVMTENYTRRGTISVKPDTSYKLSHISHASDGRIYFYDAEGNALSSYISIGSSNPKTFTTPENCATIGYYCRITSDTTLYTEVSQTKPMLTLASETDDTYEAYSGTSVTIDLDGTRYGGTLDVVNGTMTVDRAIVDLGTLTYAYYSSATIKFRSTTALPDVLIPATSSTTIDLLCSAYPTMTYAELATSTLGVCIVHSGGYGGQVWANDSNYSDETAFKNAMSGVMLCYPLANPLTVQLTAQQISALVGQNVVWASTGNIESLGYYTNDTSEAINDTRQMMADTTTTMTAPRNLTVNEFVIVNNRLYQLTANVASGSALVVGTNVTETTVAEVLTALLNA